MICVSKQSSRNPCWPKTCVRAVCLLFLFAGWEPQGAGSTFVTVILATEDWWESGWDETKLDFIPSLLGELVVDFNCVMSLLGLSFPISLFPKVT